MEARLRIALLAPLVTPLLPEQYGGSQAVASDLGAELQSRGHEVVVFASRGSRIDGVELFELNVDSANLQDALHRGDGHSHVTDVLTRSFRLAYETIGDGFDVVHNHGFDPPAITEALVLDSPVVHTLHLPPTQEMTGAIALTRESRSKFVCVSQSQAALWGEEIVDRVILNGVPIHRIPWEGNPDPYVMFAGRLSREKGAHIAIDIAKDAGIPIVVAGPTYDKEYEKEEIRSRTESEGVRMLGHLSRATVWRFMSRAQAVIVPSLWDEPFGLVAAEANAAGAPVLATKRGGLAETLEEGVTGFYIDPSDTRSAARALHRSSELDRKEIRRRAEERFSLARMALSYEEVYEQAKHRPKVRL